MWRLMSLPRRCGVGSGTGRGARSVRPPRFAASHAPAARTRRVSLASSHRSRRCLRRPRGPRAACSRGGGGLGRRLRGGGRRGAGDLESCDASGGGWGGSGGRLGEPLDDEHAIGGCRQAREGGAGQTRRQLASSSRAVEEGHRAWASSRAWAKPAGRSRSIRRSASRSTHPAKAPLPHHDGVTLGRHADERCHAHRPAPALGRRERTARGPTPAARRATRSVRGGGAGPGGLRLGPLSGPARPGDGIAGRSGFILILA